MLNILYKNGASYTISQTIDESAGGLFGVKLSEDRNEIFAGAYDNNLRVYRKNGASYTLNQTIYAGFQVFFINHIPGKLEVHGFSFNALFFEHDGTEYKLIQTIVTASFIIRKTIKTDDFSRFVFGGSSLKMEMYEKLNGTYELTEELELGKNIYQIATDPRWLYFIVTTFEPSIDVLYRCPEECSSCSFPNNCTSCQEGYALEGGVCQVIMTNCVQNKFIKGKVCE